MPHRALPNRIVLWLLRSPFSGVLEGAVVGLSLRGRRSGHTIELPVQYAVGDDAIWVWPSHAANKRWWRNLLEPAPVELRLRGDTVTAVGQAVTEGAQDGRRAYKARFPRAANALPDRDEVVMVRLTVSTEVLQRARPAPDPPGRGVSRVVRRHPLGSYFVLTFTVSWGYWIPVAATGGHWSHFPGLAGPMVAAVMVTAITGGRPGLGDLLARAVRWRVPVRWYAATALLLVAALGAILLTAAVGADVPTVREFSTMPGLPAVGWFGVLALTFLVNGFGEEVGWRGHAWPELRRRHTLAGAAMLLAPPWALWHVPTFWIDSGMRGFPLVMIPGFLIGLTAGAVVLGWLYEQARSSLFVVALWHAVLNMVSATKGAEGFMAAAVTALVIFWAIRILRTQAAETVISTEDRSVTAERH